jgi:RHS repeat-associated protein
MKLSIQRLLVVTLINMGLMHMTLFGQLPLGSTSTSSKLSSAFTYTNTAPHQVSTATVKGAARTYTYNAAGHVTSDGKRSYGWSSTGQIANLHYAAAPALHDLGNNILAPPAHVQSQFFFDASGSRARQMKTRTESSGTITDEITLYLGSYEREIHRSAPNSSTTPQETKRVHRHSLGDLIYTRTITPAEGEQVRLSTKLEDHLGSTDVILTALWNPTSKTFTVQSTEHQAYDPWGERAHVATASPYRQADSDPFHRSATDYDRGYTGHEMLDDSGLIHMNGRLYDAELGRMLSPDPYVQVPEYSQNFNRYSYVLNNPLNKTDPTGYSWLSKAFHKIGSWLKENWRSVVSIALGAVLMFTGIGGTIFAALYSGITGSSIVGMSMSAFYAGMGAVTGSIMGAVNAALSGGSFGDVLRGAAVGAVQGAISSGPLHAMESATSLGGKLAHVVGHGVVGGAANEALGGKFQDGFLSAAAGAAAVHTGLYSAFKGNNLAGIAGRTAVAGIIGGTASALGGGKFANGAWTAAFQHLLNNEAEFFDDDAHLDSYFMQSSQTALGFYKGFASGFTFGLYEPTYYSTAEKYGSFTGQSTEFATSFLYGKGEAKVLFESGAVMMKVIPKGLPTLVKAKNLVYVGLENGQIRYVGITARNIFVRQAEHLRSGKNIFLQQVNGAVNLTRTQARVIEQTLINQYRAQGVNLMNRINSIDPRKWNMFGIK